MGREVRRVPRNYKGFADHRNKWRDDSETCLSPKGVGYQLWETTSAGSPISPVFATEDEFVAWLTQPQPIGIGGRITQMTEEGARAFARDGWSPTMVFTPSTGLVSGLEYEDVRARE